MKYCSKCGHELIDEAVICTSCGCSLQVSEKKEKKGGVETKSFLPLNIVNFLFSILAISAFLFMMLSLIFPYIDSGYWDYYHPNFAWALVAFIISCVALAFSFISIVTSSICAILKKVKSNYVFASFSQFFLSAVLFTVTLIMMINGW